jgi:NAD(P) transhydrogenase subunit alpha
MKIGIPAETRQGETRVAATPETVKKLVAAKHQVVVQSGAGVAASVTDEAFSAAGAQIGTAADAFGCEMVLKVRAPSADERAQINTGTVLVGMTISRPWLALV